MVHEYDKNLDVDIRKDFEITSLVIITFLYVLRTGGDASGFFLSPSSASYLMKRSLNPPDFSIYVMNPLGR